LEEALVGAALELIRIEGVDALTLRAVGLRVGVSRTALYRHFADKAALLGRVAAQGFRLLREALTMANHGEDGLSRMGEAYVAFALANEGYYRAMFGRVAAEWCKYPELMSDGENAFRVLLDAVIAGQQAGRLVPDDPMGIARVLWAALHGVAMLTLDGHVSPSDGVAKRTVDALRDGIRPR
jgi:AcrR family transcriptional regulator